MTIETEENEVAKINEDMNEVMEGIEIGNDEEEKEEKD